MQYTIKKNEQYDSLEIYFSEKPEKSIIEALKSLKMRWNKSKSCWYGFVEENALTELLNAPEITFGIKAEEGYLGATKYVGNNHDKFDYSTKCFREAFKAAGVKGVTARYERYSGGCHIYFTVQMKPEDYMPFEEYQVETNWAWFDYKDDAGEYHDIRKEEFYELPEDQQRDILGRMRKYQYDKYISLGKLCRGGEIANNALSAQGRARIEFIRQIIMSFNYDDSNSMVDYFDVNFYWDMDAKKEIA